MWHACQAIVHQLFSALRRHAAEKAFSIMPATSPTQLSYLALQLVIGARRQMHGMHV